MAWKKLEQAGAVPGPRSSHAICCIGDDVYMFGGELQARVPVDDGLYKGSLSSGVWSKLHAAEGTSPGPRVAATMVAVGNKIYLFGGRTGIDMGEGAQSDLFVFDTCTLTWTPLPQQQDDLAAAPPPRSYHAMAAAGGKVYIFGGCGTSGRLSDLWCFDPSSSSWTKMPACDAVGPRGGPVLVAAPDDTKLFVMGGFNGAEMADCHVFDISSSSWSCPTCCSAPQQQPTAGGSCSRPLVMPLARSVFGAAAHGCCQGRDHQPDPADESASCSHWCHIVTFGGEVSPSDKGHAGAGNFTAAAYCLAPAHLCKIGADVDGWHELGVASQGSEGPGPRGWFASTGVRGRDLLVHGGLGQDNQRLGDMWLLQLH
eukprot:gene3513-3783_t